MEWAGGRLGRTARWCLTILAAGASLALGPSPARGQEGGPPTRFWLALGPSAGASYDNESDFGGLFQLTYQRAPHHVSLRAIGMADFGSFPDGGDDSAGEVTLMYGRTLVSTWGYAAAATGLGVVLVEGCSQPPTDECRTVGLPLAAEVGMDADVIGLSLHAFGNLNTLSSFGGLALLVRLGWMP